MTAARIHRELDAAGVERCPSCDAPLATPYCASCGEQRASDRHYTLRHLGAELFETLTHADGRALRTIRALVTRPGELTAEYMRGARRAYIPPLQLFFLVNVVFFLWVGVTHTNMFSTPLRFQVHGTLYSDLASRLVAARVGARHVTYQSYEAAFDHTASLQAKSLIILLVPILAALTALVVFPRRRPGAQHAVFALHVMTEVLLLVIAITLAIGLAAAALRVAGMQPRWQMWDQLSAVALVFALGVYVHRALRRVYGFSGMSAALRAVIFGVAFIPTIFLYRAVLFFTTFYMT